MWCWVVAVFSREQPLMRKHLLQASWVQDCGWSGHVQELGMDIHLGLVHAGKALHSINYSSEVFYATHQYSWTGTASIVV